MDTTYTILGFEDKTGNAIVKLGYDNSTQTLASIDTSTVEGLTAGLDVYVTAYIQGRELEKAQAAATVVSAEVHALVGQPQTVDAQGA